MARITNAPFYIGEVVAGDWNGDGKQDLAGAWRELTVMLGNGDGTFAQATIQTLPTTACLLKTALVDAGSTLDLLVVPSDPGDVLILLGDGQGGFVARPGVPAGTLCNDVVTGDLNGDGKLDLVIADGGGFNNLDGSVKIALGNGDGTPWTSRKTKRQVS
ncbi:MAG: VCBS repeat-containing protein [Verrucomicrobiales bacterium]|nr:VCBS repeat-containing protein [Verrucomicrobiales bacterium]